MSLFRSLAILLLALCLCTPAAGAKRPKVLFMGSSTVFFWSHTGTLATDFSRFEAVNLGVGGTDYKFLIEKVGDWVAANPDTTQVVLYSGDNDVAYGAGPAQIAQNFRFVAETIQSRLPLAEIHVISIKPSLAPDRMDKLSVIDQANEQLEVMARQVGVNFIGVNAAMYGADGKPRRELLGPDQLHMSRKGYELWRNFVWPSVARCEEQREAMARLAANPGEIYQLSARKDMLARVPDQASAAVGKAAVLVDRACQGQAPIAQALARAALLRGGEGQAGKFENGSALITDTLERIRTFRDGVQKDYRVASSEAKRFGSWTYNQATNAKGPPAEQAQLRREAIGGRRLADQAARKLLSVDHELSRQAARLHELGEEYLARWEKLGDAGASVKLEAARSALSRLKAERGRQDQARSALYRH